MNLEEQFLELLKSEFCYQVNAALAYSQLLPYRNLDWPIINQAIMDKWSKSGLVKVKTMAWQLYQSENAKKEDEEMYPDLIKRFGRRKVNAAIKALKESGIEPAYVEILVRLEAEE